MMMRHLLNGLSIVAAIARMVRQVQELWGHEFGSVIRLGVKIKFAL